MAIKLRITNLNAPIASSSSSEPSAFNKFAKDLDQKVSSFSNSIASKMEMLKQKLASKRKNSEPVASEPTSNVLEAPSNKPLYAVHDDLIEVCLVVTLFGDH